MNDVVATQLTVKDFLEHPQIKGRMISGTSKGHPSYLVFARKSMIGLSLRIEGVHSGASSGKPGTTYLPIRIRSSNVEKLFAEEDAKNGVTNFPITPVKAWPEIEFPIVRGSESASTVIGKFIAGTVNTDHDIYQKELADKKLAKEIVKYLQQLAGPDNFTVHYRVLQDFLHASYSSIFEAVEKSYGIFKGMKDAAEAEDVGVFTNMAAKMKKKHDELVKPQVGDVEDNDELDGTDENGED